MNSRIIHIEDIGAVEVRKNRRCRSIRISVAPRNGVRVSVPYGVPFDEAEKFLYEKAGWIKKHKLWVDRLEEESRKFAQECRPIDKDYARALITRRTDELAKLYGFSYNRLCVRSQKTRWGSCSHKNNININLKSLYLPEDLLDYIILHELMHTRIKDHSKGFWNAFEKIFPEAKAFDKKLRQYQAHLF